MGYALSWIAVKGRSNGDLQKTLGFRSTGKHGNYGEHSLVGQQLRNGWYILIANTCDDRITKSQTLARLSKGCQAVACSIEEHVMLSSCAFWNEGRRVWSVKHRGDHGVFDVVQSGKAPENYPSLKNELIEKQKSEGGEEAGVDYVFELALHLAKQLVGFKHDEEASEIADGSYEIFELNYSQRVLRAVAASKAWLYLVGVLIGVMVLLGLVAVVVRGSIDWMIQLVKGFVP
jgi:hypothetical protein